MDELGLHLPALSLNNFPSAKIKVDELFNEWLSLEGTTTLCAILLESVSLNQQLHHNLNNNHSAP